MEQGYVLLYWQRVPDLLHNKYFRHYIKDYKACNGAKRLRLEQLILCSLGSRVLGSKNSECNVTFSQLQDYYKILKCVDEWSKSSLVFKWIYIFSRFAGCVWCLRTAAETGSSFKLNDTFPLSKNIIFTTRKLDNLHTY